MRKLLASVLLTLALGTGVAQAQDYNRWSGFYVGAQAGAAWGDARWTFLDANFFGAAGTQIPFENFGALKGLHLGANHQWGNFVLGAEVAYSMGPIKDEVIGGNPAFPNDRLQMQLDNLLTITGRVGYAMDRTLVYIKGGYALGRVHGVGVSGPPGAGVPFTMDNERLGGWTVGAGLDFKLTRSIVLGLEYGYVNLNSESAVGRVFATPFRMTVDDVEVHSVMARLSFLIGRDAPEPLK